MKPGNEKANRKDRHLASEQTGKRQVVVVARERCGWTIPLVVAKESDGTALVRTCVALGSTVYTDGAAGWDMLHAHYNMHRSNHKVAFGLNGACTNQVESYFSCLHQAEMGQHHHISRKYLPAYVAECA